jgi:hypothetical protein
MYWVCISKFKKYLMATNYGYSKHCNGCAKIITPTHLKQFEGSYNV